MKTEEHIKEIARRIFFAQGRFDARLHEIAKEAEVNKALLHYYFRDRENLLQVVYAEAVEASFLRMFAILSEKTDFEKKVEKAVNHITSYLAEYPFIETFIISQLNSAGSGQDLVLPIKAGKVFTKAFATEVKAYLAKRKLTRVSPEQFIVNMMALCAYPSSTKPVIQGILGYNERQYGRFLKSRKKTLVSLVLMKH